MEDRPIALTVLPENIPVELKQRPQWVCWRYELRKEKWTKVPYGAKDYKAAANRPTSWQSFQGAWELYATNDFDGIGYVFSADDPYVGGDQDHNLSTDALPPTYTEVSPSGGGLKFIAKAAGHYGRKTAKGEIYSALRFFTITGHVLEGRTVITECQEAVDAFHASLGGRATSLGDGTAGTGSRAERAATIPEEEWAKGRQERRENINQLLHRLRSSSISKKTRNPDTQLGYLLKEDYRGFHEKWPYAGIVRADGTIDSSQIRAVMASSIKGRGFTFPQFAALMSYFFGAECAAKTGTKQGVREEFASLWFLGRSPRADEYQPEVIEPAARGRAGDHQTLVERAYAILISFKAGTEALLTVQDLADALGVHRRTASGLLSELTTAGRITYRQSGQHGGIVVRFAGMIYPESTKGVSQDTNAPSNSNGHKPISAENGIDHTSGVIYSENENTKTCATGADKEAIDSLPITADGSTPSIYIYNQYCVSSAATIIPEISLRDAVAHALETLPKDRVNERTGTLTKWPITNERIIEHVQGGYPGRWKDGPITYWADKLRKQRKAETFNELKAMRREALEKKAASVRKRIARAEDQAKTNAMAELREWYGKQAKQLAGQLALLSWELARRDQADEQRIAVSGYSPGEQQEMLDLVERERREPPPTKRVSLPTQSNMAASLIANLHARKLNDGS